jgi:hypothetical protein
VKFQRPPCCTSNNPSDSPSRIAAKILPRLRPYNWSCSYVAFKLPFSVPAWLQCSISRKSIRRLKLTLIERHAGLASSSRVKPCPWLAFGWPLLLSASSSEFPRGTARIVRLAGSCHRSRYILDVWGGVARLVRLRPVCGHECPLTPQTHVPRRPARLWRIAGEQAARLGSSQGSLCLN